MTDHTKLLARLRTAPPNVLKDREAADAITALQAENAQWRVDFKEMVIERNAALARLAELPDTCDGKEQEAFEAYAVGEKLNMQCHPLHYLFLNGETYAARQGWKAAILYCRKQVDAAGASPVEPNFCESCAMGLSTCDCVTPRPVFVNQLPSAQPSQAQPPAPSEAAREYMTGYSDAKEWAKPSQALELSDDEIDALLPTITLKGLDPKQQVWLTKKDAIAFARAIIAAIKQGGQHD